MRPVTLKEITKALIQMSPEKAPGLDGFNASFYQWNWDLVGINISRQYAFSYISGKLLKEVNHTFHTLIPKVSSSSHLVDFWPISKQLYKIISKLFSNELQVVITDLISPNQSAFLKGGIRKGD